MATNDYYHATVDSDDINASAANAYRPPMQDRNGGGEDHWQRREGYRAR